MGDILWWCGPTAPVAHKLVSIAGRVKTGSSGCGVVQVHAVAVMREEAPPLPGQSATDLNRPCTRAATSPA